jgi:hypothetical protein
MNTTTKVSIHGLNFIAGVKSDVGRDHLVKQSSTIVNYDQLEMKNPYDDADEELLNKSKTSPFRAKVYKEKEVSLSDCSGKQL